MSQGGSHEEDGGAVRETWQQILAWLRANASPSLDKLRLPITPEALAGLETSVGSVPEQLQALLRCNEGEDEWGGILGGWRLFPADRIKEEHRIELEALACSDDFHSSADWIPLSGESSANLVVIDRTSGRVLLRGYTETTPLGDSLVALLERFLAELRAGFWFWNDVEGRLAHREGHWIGTFPLVTPSGDLPEFLRFLTETLRRAPNAEELEALERYSVADRIRAADSLLDAYGHSWVARGHLLFAVLLSLRDRGADWLQAHWHDDHLSDRVRIRCAPLCFPSDVALSMALSVFDAERSDPHDLMPVAGEPLLAWLDDHPPTHVVPKWGALVANCSPTWARLKRWLDRGRPHSLLALDALALALTSGQWSRDGEVHTVRHYDLSDDAVIRELPDPRMVAAAVREYASKDAVPRVRATAEAITAAL